MQKTLLSWIRPLFFRVKTRYSVRLPKEFKETLIGFEPFERRLALTATLLPAFEIGTPLVTDLWVNPTQGNDASSGAGRQQALRTLTEAWGRIPAGTTLSQGVRIHLMAGTYAESDVPHYWEQRRGTLAAPIILEAADGAGTARLPAMNIYDCHWLYLIGLDISAGGGDVLHLDSCSHILIRQTTIRGLGDIFAYAAPQETLKANQCQYVFIENSDISGATDNAVDFVGVQYGHVVGNKIHRSVDWAMYAKGGSAYLTVAGNEFYDAGTGGFTAGQGTGFEFMVSPWLHYEAYDIKFINNVIHDTQGAGIGVNGGYNILMAHNTLYRVGARSHLIEVVFGSRTCDGNQAACRTFLQQGGWGTTVVGGDEPVPNRNVFIYNNVVLNPAGYTSAWQQFVVATPRTPGIGSNIPSLARADTNLQIRGNVIFNGPADHSLGIESASLSADVLAHNLINSVQPILVDPLHGDYRLSPSFTPPAAVDLPDFFTWADAPLRPVVPTGTLVNRVAYDRNGLPRTSPGTIGAFVAGDSGSIPVVPPTPLPILPPVVIQSIRLPAAKTYRAGEVLTLQAAMNAVVIVVGTPRISITIGSIVKEALYTSGSGSRELTFVYTVVTGDNDANGIALASSVTLPPTATIQRRAGANILLGLPTTNTAAIRIDTDIPRPVAVLAPLSSLYRIGDVLSFSVRYSESVIVTGVPNITLKIGSTTRQARYATGSGSDTLIFRYTVVAGDTASRGIGLGQWVNLPPGAAIGDSAGNAARRLLPIPNTAGVRIAVSLLRR